MSWRHIFGIPRGRSKLCQPSWQYFSLACFAAHNASLWSTSCLACCLPMKRMSRVNAWWNCCWSLASWELFACCLLGFASMLALVWWSPSGTWKSSWRCFESKTANAFAARSVISIHSLEHRCLAIVHWSSKLSRGGTQILIQAGLSKTGRIGREIESRCTCTYFYRFLICI